MEFSNNMTFIKSLDPNVLSAIIAALTSLIIAGISGVYVLVSTRKRTEKIREDIIAETMARMSVENFHTDLQKYRAAHSNFNKEALSISQDMSALFPLMFRFYCDTARLFALRQKEFISLELFKRIEITDNALDEILSLKVKGEQIAPEELADRAYKGMKSIIEGLAEL